MGTMRTSVLINCYNYGRYIGDAILSVLKQTRTVDEIIIVDDGSTDDSLERIQEAVREERNILVISKPNEGQLSALNTGFEHATGDILFFLDADDLFEADHVEKVCRIYEENKEVDTVWTAFRKFGDETGEYYSYDTSVYFGHTTALSCVSYKYIGGVTSTVSIRRKSAERFMPVDRRFYSDWRTRADDWLTHGAAVAGCTKYFFHAVTVAYRIHGSNNFARRAMTSGEEEKYKQIRSAMYEHVRRIAHVPDDVEARLVDEFQQYRKPSGIFLRMYWKAVWKRRRVLKGSEMLSLWGGLLRHYFISTP